MPNQPTTNQTSSQVIVQKKTYQSQFYPEAITGRKNLSELIYEVGEKYMKKVENRRVNHQRGQVKAASYLLQLFYWTYLTGSRLSESITKPYPIIAIEKAPKGFPSDKMISIERVNLKHFDKKDKVGVNSKGKPIYRGRRDAREIISQSIPVFPEDEKMWAIVLNNFHTTDLKYLFEYFADVQFKNSKKVKKQAQTLTNIKKSNSRLTNLFKYSFKMNLKDYQGNVYKNAGIHPHLLRHARAHFLYLQKKLPEGLVTDYFGWTSPAMLRYYRYSSKELKKIAMKEKWEELYPAPQTTPVSTQPPQATQTSPTSSTTTPSTTNANIPTPQTQIQKEEKKPNV